jgi:hypothetical protein
LLNDAGLNLQAVLALDKLPTRLATELRRQFDPDYHYRQLIMIGHGGRWLWEAVRASDPRTENPIDDFSARTVAGWFRQQFAGQTGSIIYPGSCSIDLQELGRIVGWHNDSPLMIGIREDWGTWFAYRVVMLTTTDLEPSRPRRNNSPCEHCADKPCIDSCPAAAMNGGSFALDKCTAYRLQLSSRCKATCLARVSCPVGNAHRYSDEQMQHCYSISLREIARNRKPAA